MRDLAVTILVFASIPLIVYRPYVGVLVWSWLGYMNPHRLSWGFAFEMHFALVVGIVTIVAMIFSTERKRLPWTRETVVLLCFVGWIIVTTVFAQRPEYAPLGLEKVLKIQVMTFVTLVLINTRERIQQLIWVIVLSLGFYGVKGGLFTILTGGGYHVRGPEESFIGGNNEIGLALIMVVPLMRYLQLRSGRGWVRLAWFGAMGLTVVAILGTQSRGALVGLVAMALFMILKSRQRLALLLIAAAMIPVTFTLMPESWFERMRTIQTYEEDPSVQGRFDAWQYAYETARQRPLVGGGFMVFLGRTDAHSIYFEVLGEHGFVGLALFLLLGWFTWWSGSRVILMAKNRAGLEWAQDLAAMLQVSVLGYATAGAFLGLAYFDLYYHLVAIMVLCKSLVLERAQRESEQLDGAAAAPRGGAGAETGRPEESGASAPRGP